MKRYQIDFNNGGGSHACDYHDGDLQSAEVAAVVLIKERRLRPVNVAVFEYCRKKKDRVGGRQLFFSSGDVRRYRNNRGR